MISVVALKPSRRVEIRSYANAEALLHAARVRWVEIQTCLPPDLIFFESPTDELKAAALVAAPAKFFVVIHNAQELEQFVAVVDEIEESIATAVAELEEIWTPDESAA